MTNATKTLALVFAGTLALALATSWSWSGSSSAAFQQELLAVDTSAVQTVRIERSESPPIRLERTSSGWAVAPADTSATYPADRGAVTRLLTSLPTLQVNAVATRQPDKHPRYGVDSTGTRVAMLGSNNEVLGELIVGRTRIRRPQSQGQNQNPMQRMRRRRGTPITYVRSPDRPDVYSIEQSFSSLSQGVEGWRDKQIWAVDRSKIQRIHLRFPGDSSFTMQRSTPDDTASAVGPATWVSAGDTLSSNEASSMVRTLSSPQANGFAEGTSPESLGEPRYAITLRLSDGSKRTLRLYSAPSRDAYLATTDEFPYVARLPKTTLDRTVLQGRSALLENQ